MRRLMIGMMLVFALAGLVLPAGAQGGGLPFAAITQNQLILYGLSAAPTPVTAGPFTAYGYLTWSPDGNTLAFYGLDAEYNEHLMVTDRAGTAPVEVATDAVRMFPLSFAADGSIIYAADSGEMFTDPNGMGGQIVNINTILPAAGAAPITVGRFNWGVGCGGGSSIPAHWRYWSETESGPSNSPLMMAVTPFGIVHSLNCTGVGTALVDPSTGTDAELGTQLGWVSVSPDGTRLIGISKQYGGAPTGQLVLVDLASRSATPLPITAPVVPDLAVWSADGNAVFYSTIQESGNVIPATPEEQQKLGEATGYMEPTTLPLNVVTIRRFNLADTTDTEVYTGPAFAIGRLAPTPDGAGLLFSQIPNMEQWVAAVVSGVMPEDPMSLLPIGLYYLDLTSGAASPVGTDMGQFAFNAGAYGG